MRNIDRLILQFRRFRSDLIKSDGSEYSVDSPSGMEETIGNIPNSGQYTNQEITDLAVQSVNLLIDAVIISGSDIKVNKSGILDFPKAVASFIPEYVKSRRDQIFPQAELFDETVFASELGLPDNFARLLSARLLRIHNGIARDVLHCDEISPAAATSIVEMALDELGGYVYLSGDSKMQILIPRKFLVDPDLVDPNDPNAVQGTGDIYLDFSYLKYQNSLDYSSNLSHTGESYDLLLSERHDPKVLEIMLQKSQSIKPIG